MRHHELRSAFIDSTGGLCEQRFGLTFIAAQTETGKGMPVGAMVHSHDPIPVLSKGLQQLNIALNRDFKPTYASLLYPHFLVALHASHHRARCVASFFVRTGAGTWTTATKRSGQ